MQGKVVAGKYELESLLGEGGVGQVWRARHRVTKRAHAVKLIAADSGGETSLERFLREAESFAHVRHPGVVEILDAGRDADGTLYLVMELLEGRTLRQWLDVPGRRPWEGVDILREALEPLMAAHEARGPDGASAPIVHRDLKPANIFVLDRPLAPAPGQARPTRVKLLDFGIARWVGTAGPTAVGVTLGTPLYASPEQVRDPRSVTARADVWSMGVILYEIFAGKQPFLGTNYFEVVAKIWEDEPPPLPAWAPAPLVALVRECLAKDPLARPADARAMSRRMDAVLAEASGSAVPAASIGRPRLDDSELGTVPTEIVLPLVRARGKDSSGSGSRASSVVAAAVATVGPPVAATAPQSRAALAGMAERVVPAAAPGPGAHGSGSAPRPAVGSSGSSVIPATRAGFAPEEMAEIEVLRKRAPNFTAPREPAGPASAAPSASAAAPSASAAAPPPATTTPAVPRFSERAPPPATASAPRAAFSNDDAPDASTLPGYGRLRVLVALGVLAVLGVGGAAAAWYFGLL